MYTGSDDARSRSGRRLYRRPGGQLVNPICLPRRRFQGDKPSGLLWSPQLGDVIEDIDSSNELGASLPCEHHQPVSEPKGLRTDVNASPIGKLLEALDLAAVSTSQPYLPPRDVTPGGEFCPRVGRQLFQRRQLDGMDAVDQLAVARRLIRRRREIGLDLPKEYQSRPSEMNTTAWSKRPPLTVTCRTARSSGWTVP